jgi:hypothetical protein
VLAVVLVVNQILHQLHLAAMAVMELLLAVVVAHLVAT